MDVTSIVRLIALAAIWGASFLFLRMGAPVFGPAVLIELRVAIAALFLWGVAWWMKKTLALSTHWRHYLFVGFFNTALPFLMFAYAAKTLPASLLSILNSTAPLFGAVVASIWLRMPINKSTAIGLAVGIGGVAVLVGGNVSVQSPDWRTAVVIGLLAPLCYGIASTYTKAAAVKVDPFNNAHGSMWMAMLVALPMLLIAPVQRSPVSSDWMAVIALGVLCTGFAYLLYFRLIEDVGPVSALTVTFLIPLFGVLWGHLFLNEPIGWNLVVGGGMVLLGAGFANGVLRIPLGQTSGAGPS